MTRYSNLSHMLKALALKGRLSQGRVTLVRYENSILKTRSNGGDHDHERHDDDLHDHGEYRRDRICP